MNLDYLTNQFKNGLMELINNSQLPPSLVYYIIKDILNGVKDVVTNSILQAEYELHTKEGEVTQEIPLKIIGQNKSDKENSPKSKE